MKDYLLIHPWKIIEKGFHPQMNKVSESIFSLGNGRLGQRANFEEYYSGETLQGNYIGGVYYPDKTRVGWWKNGYPEYYAKVLNAANWNILDFYINGKRLDLATVQINSFYRELDMQEGILRRTVELEMADGTRFEITSERINSLENKEVCLIDYTLKCIEGEANITCKAEVDFDVRNEDSNYEENFWENYESHIEEEVSVISASTKKTGFKVAVAQKIAVSSNSSEIGVKNIDPENRKIGHHIEVQLKNGGILNVQKYVAQLSSLNHKKEDILTRSIDTVSAAFEKGYSYYKDRQQTIWKEKWNDIDIVIEGDDSAQQGIRFNIFHLHQTYSGDDYRLNIGPKGFTG